MADRADGSMYIVTEQVRTHHDSGIPVAMPNAVPNATYSSIEYIGSAGVRIRPGVDVVLVLNKRAHAWEAMPASMYKRRGYTDTICYAYYNDGMSAADLTHKPGKYSDLPKLAIADLNTDDDTALTDVARRLVDEGIRVFAHVSTRGITANLLATYANGICSIGRSEYNGHKITVSVSYVPGSNGTGAYSGTIAKTDEACRVVQTACTHAPIDSTNKDGLSYSIEFYKNIDAYFKDSYSEFYTKEIVA